jgi:phosphotransferase family enzyme
MIEFQEAEFSRSLLSIQRHRLIVRHPSRADVIGVEDLVSPALPQVYTSDNHTAEVEKLIAAFETHYGMSVTVLRSLTHGEARNGVVERSHEIEVHSGMERGSLHWRPAASLTFDARDRAVVAAWRAPVSEVAGCDWTVPGWFDTACAWIDDALRGAGLAAPLRIRQLRTWASSCLLEAVSEQSLYFFKALPNVGRVEHAVTRFLSENFPSSVPRVIAVDADRCWLLLHACEGRKLEMVNDIAPWARAAQRYGDLQVACMSRVDDLERMGCPRRKLESLPDAVSALAADESVIRPGEADGLSHRETARLRELVPSLPERCAALHACRIPDSLEHGDLWPGNVFVDAHDSAVIDWEDVAIAHPFLSLAPLTVGLGDAGLASRTNIDRIESEYLRAFESISSPAEIRRALRIAAPLCFFDMAVRYRAQHPSVMRLHPWMRELVPQTLRLALARI